MDKSCFQFDLTKPEQNQFNKDGYILLKNVLTPQQISRSIKAIDKLYKPPGFFSIDGFIEKDDIFLELVDYKKILPKMWSILGWNIYLYHTHLSVTPFCGNKNDKSAILWHQDFATMNDDTKECNPPPRLSVKAGYFLTDTLEPRMGSLLVVPGSHLSDEKLPNFADHKEVLAHAGDAIIFDRRLWHAPGRNCSNKTRYAMFYTYGPRWLRPHDIYSDKYLARIKDPILKQLLGHKHRPDGYSYYQPILDDVPLRVFLIKNKKAV